MMKTLAPVVAALAVLTTLIVVVACQDDDVGIPCKIVGSSTDAGTGTNINGQAMDCRSRLCLKYGTQPGAMCTTTCDGDSDCPDDTETCPEGFMCLPAVETGALRCCKMCVCKKYVVTGSDAGASISQECNTNPNKNCPDL